MYSGLMYCLRLLKLFHDIGIYEKVAGDIQQIREDDYFELCLLGFEFVAPTYDREELGEDCCCGGHILHHFSDPVIPEYYRLCRLYEYKHSISPEENPYVKKADDYFTKCCRNTSSDFGAGYNDDVHIKEILIEICPERHVYEDELIIMIYDVLQFYRQEVVALHAELARGPLVWLPALPAPSKRAKNTTKPRSHARGKSRKAS